MALYLPRGSVVQVDVTESARASEAGASHPLLAAVIQSDHFRFGKTVLLVPFTTNLDRAKDPFGVLVASSEQNGLRQDSVAMCWQLMSVDRSRILGGPKGRLAAAALDLIAKDLAILVDYMPRYGAPSGPAKS